MCTMTKPPSQNIRLTISVSPEVHAAFKRMAEVSGMSIGRSMGEWLADTLEGVQFVTDKLQRAREAPRQVAQELRASALGAADMLDEALRSLRAGPPAGGDPDRASVRRTVRATPELPSAPAAAQNVGQRESPRPVIRGGKSPGKTRTKTKPRDPK
jgi:hypothetical protein